MGCDRCFRAAAICWGVSSSKIVGYAEILHIVYFMRHGEWLHIVEMALCRLTGVDNTEAIAHLS